MTNPTTRNRPLVRIALVIPPFIVVSICAHAVPDTATSSPVPPGIAQRNKYAAGSESTCLLRLHFFLAEVEIRCHRCFAIDSDAGIVGC